MRIDYYHIRPQIDELLSSYTELNEAPNDASREIILSGNISINRIYDNFLVDRDYEIRIRISLHDDDLPEVWDVGNHIDKSYIHRYPDGKLCLETDAYTALCFYKGYSLLEWMKNIVEPYYYSYEYYTRFGKFPYGERSHDLDGVVEAYQEIFNEQDIVKIFRLLRSISQRKYKGHLMCPCGSGIITRKCHGSYIFPFIHDEQLYRITQRDYMNICEEIKKYDKQ